MTRSAGPDVLVAGAGPVGLLAAYELARRGVAVRLVDAATGPTATSRAIATHARTLEVYDQLGLLDRFLARGQVISGFSVFQGGRRLVRLEADYRATPTRRPFTLAIEQVATEAVLREAAAEVGVRPEWDTALATIEQDGDTVTVGLEHADGSRESVRVPWLVGCDGGHSTVRKLLDLRLHGSSNQTWLLADAPLAVDLPRDSIYFIRTGGATLMAVPLRDGNRWRLLDTVDVDDGGGPRAVADRFAAKLRAGLGRDLVVGDPTWVSVFTAQQRMVSGMRTGRCLVAGDAAHVHSPASGQGMNTGLQEAYNLAWKLAMVVHGYAGPGLLDTYPQERMPVGAALLASTERATDLIDLHNWFADLLLPVAMSAVRVFPPLRHRVQTKILSGISGLALSYADSALAAD
ncbi:MAG TPA: FAD-dependent monooxygenase, partial [Streptosporangiaceae bacterium]|nr:FAD-dependent monooxygenase [Streptosporangiaceae bacterium]